MTKEQRELLIGKLNPRQKPTIAERNKLARHQCDAAFGRADEAEKHVAAKNATKTPDAKREAAMAIMEALRSEKRLLRRHSKRLMNGSPMASRISQAIGRALADVKRVCDTPTSE